MIVTFYSFKGGVGRTLALANVAVVLARKGHRVLVADFDLEAPGLTRYLESVFGSDLQTKPGLLDLLERQQATGDAEDHLKSYAVRVLTTANGGSLELLTSGRQDESYAKRLLEFNWPHFFLHADGGDFIESCREEWSEHYDYVLIDSRTGITDSGGICTIQLPDVIVPVFTASRQSVDGVVDVMHRAQEGRQLLAYDRAPAAIVPLPSKFDSRAEYAASQQWLSTFAASFAGFYTSWLPEGASVRQAIERTKLPYVPFFSFGERLPALEETGTDPESLSYALHTFAGLLAAGLQDPGGLFPSASDVPEADQPRSRLSRRTLIQMGIATALVGVSGVGIGVAIGRRPQRSAVREEQIGLSTVDTRGASNPPQAQTIEVFDVAFSDLALAFSVIPAGSFPIGSPDGEPKRRPNEGPQQRITMRRFAMSRTTVTQRQWAALVDAEPTPIAQTLARQPSFFVGDNLPVETISWFQATEFCARLSRLTSLAIRLPSESEWEYACRAGTVTPFHFGPTVTPELANYCGTGGAVCGTNGGKDVSSATYSGATYETGAYADGPVGIFNGRTVAVGTYPPNGFGLFEMHGNIWEHCADSALSAYSGQAGQPGQTVPGFEVTNYQQFPTDGSAVAARSDSHVLRGGAWSFNPAICRSAYRDVLRSDSTGWEGRVGLRVVCELD